MRIAIDLTALSDRLSGLERCAYELTRAMIQRAPEVHFILIVKNTPPGKLRRLKASNVSYVRIRSRRKLIGAQLALPLAAARMDADIFFFPVFPVPLLFPALRQLRRPRLSRRLRRGERKSARIYALIADAVCMDVPETMRLRARIYWRAGLRHSVRTAEGIITVSSFSAGRIRKTLGVKPEKITIAENGIRRECLRSKGSERRAEALRRCGIETPYWLSLSTMEPRKEIPLLLEAYTELRREGEELPPLIVAGRDGWLDTSKARYASAPGIHFTGFLREADLAEVYAGAEAFLYPSCYEGFGLPPLEAQAAGVRRVLVSDAPALREVLGETAMYFHRGSLASLKEKLRCLKRWEGVSAQRIEENLRRFSWDRAAERVLERMGVPLSSPR